MIALQVPRKKGSPKLKLRDFLLFRDNSPAARPLQSMKLMSLALRSWAKAAGGTIRKAEKK